MSNTLDSQWDKDIFKKILNIYYNDRLSHAILLQYPYEVQSKTLLQAICHILNPHLKNYNIAQAADVYYHDLSDTIGKIDDIRVTLNKLTQTSYVSVNKNYYYK